MEVVQGHLHFIAVLCYDHPLAGVMIDRKLFNNLHTLSAALLMLLMKMVKSGPRTLSWGTPDNPCDPSAPGREFAIWNNSLFAVSQSTLPIEKHRR
jgi:hypothetical protein